MFEMRSGVEAGKASPFYQGVLFASGNQISAAKRTLDSVIKASSPSDEAYEAHDVLGNMFFRNGMYHEAFGEIQAALRERPNGEDAKGMLPILAALDKFPPMAVVAFRPTTLKIEPGSIILPLQIEDHDAEFLFDTGANISVIGQSEADALGLVASDVEGKMGDASGQGVAGIRVTFARKLTIGGLSFRNVPFVIVSDAGEPWKSAPLKRRGIIGIPLLLAMRTIEWRPTGLFSFGAPGHVLNLASCNTLFSNSSPVIDVLVNDKHLDFTLDTGAVDTDLNPAFAKALPALVQAGKAERHSIAGLGGSVENQSILLPSVTLHFGGGKAVLQPAHVFLEHGTGTWAAGNMGMDLLGQGPGFTLDFQAMMLRLL